MGLIKKPSGLKQKKSQPSPIDAAVSRAIAKRRASPGYAQQVALLHKAVAKTLCTTKPPATLPPDDIDLIIGPAKSNAKADAVMRRAITRSRP